MGKRHDRKQAKRERKERRTDRLVYALSVIAVPIICAVIAVWPYRSEE